VTISARRLPDKSCDCSRGSDRLVTRRNLHAVCRCAITTLLQLDRLILEERSLELSLCGFPQLRFALCAPSGLVFP
jgi:hypothetical protein